jgi:hypothetical protein
MSKFTRTLTIGAVLAVLAVLPPGGRGAGLGPATPAEHE